MRTSKIQNAFTLVELIIVITILAILATIAFVSFQTYTKDSRDSNRLTSLRNIEESLNLFQVKTGNFPVPDESITIYSSGLAILRQGMVGETNAKVLGLNKVPLDPLRSEKYIFSSNVEKTKYELVTFFEKPSVSFLNETYAASESMYPKILGTRLGIVLQSDNTFPTQNIDIVTYTGSSLKGIISEKNIVVGTGKVLANINSNYDCIRIFDSGLYTQDGVYTAVQKGVSFPVYCTLKFPTTTFYNYILDGDFEDPTGTNWTNSLKKSSSAQNGSYGLEIDGNTQVFSNNFTYVDNTKTYSLEGSFRAEGTLSGLLYYGFAEYDKDFVPIYSQEVNIVQNSDTTLASSILATDTSISITDTNGTICSTWSSLSPSAFTGQTYIAFQTDDSGNYNDLPNRNLYSRGFVSLVDNGTTCTIQLINAVGKTYPAGTKIRLHLSSGTYNYSAAANVNPPFIWTKYSGNVSGSSQFGVDNLRFRRGTQFVKILILPNHRPGLPGNPAYDNRVATNYKMGIDDLKLTVN